MVSGESKTKNLAEFSGNGNSASGGRARRQLISVRNLRLRHVSVHDDVLSVYEAFELLNPVIADRPAIVPIRSLHCVAVSKPPGIEILTGFHDYRKIPIEGEIRCFAEPPDSEDEALFRVLAWDYVFATTPWQALSNKVLSQFYRHFANQVPSRVLHAYLPADKLKREFATLTPTAMELLSGISRKTLHRHSGNSRKRGVQHLRQRNLPTSQQTGKRD